MSVTGFCFRFTKQIAAITLLSMFVLFFIRLGFWQLHRADEKKQIIRAHQLFSKLPLKVWKPGSPIPPPYQKVSIQGTFLPVTFLLDNQINQHQFGYNVFSPLLLQSGEVVLIDRGWMLGDQTRKTLPTLSAPSGIQNQIGSVYYPSEKNWILGEILEKRQGDLAIIERIDTTFIQQFLKKRVYPFIIRQDSLAENGYVRNWAIVSMLPERHYAYAFQWFALAVLCMILIFVVVRKLNET